MTLPPPPDKIFDLLANQDSRLILLRREIELHAKQLDDAQREMAELRQRCETEAKGFRELLDELNTWKTQKESQIDIFKWLIGLLGSITFVVQVPALLHFSSASIFHYRSNPVDVAPKLK